MTGRGHGISEGEGLSARICQVSAQSRHSLLEDGADLWLGGRAGVGPASADRGTGERGRDLGR